MVRSQVAHLGGEPGPGAQLAGRGEAGDVADLGDQGHRGDPPDPGQGHQGLDARVGSGVGQQVALQASDDRGELVDQRQAVVDDPALGGREVQLRQPCPAGLAPQSLLDADAAVGEHGVDAVLQRGPGADQRGAVAQQGALVADRRWGDPGLR
jgi:hypothetical protein